MILHLTPVFTSKVICWDALRVVQWPDVFSLLLACELGNWHCLQYMCIDSLCDWMEVWSPQMVCVTLCLHCWSCIFYYSLPRSEYCWHMAFPVASQVCPCAGWSEDLGCSHAVSPHFQKAFFGLVHHYVHCCVHCIALSMSFLNYICYAWMHHCGAVYELLLQLCDVPFPTLHAFISIPIVSTFLHVVMYSCSVRSFPLAIHWLYALSLIRPQTMMSFSNLFLFHNYKHYLTLCPHWCIKTNFGFLI